MHTLEQLFRAYFRSAPTYNVNSASNQYAGRTTLASGSATQVVSTSVVKSDSLVRFGVEGNANLGLAAGTTTLGSGSATVVVSNASIAADSLIFTQLETDGTAQTSGVATVLEVKSQAAQNFTAGYGDAQTRAFDRTVHWMALPADGVPSDIEVRSISDGGYFVLGRSSGVAVARDAIVHWVIEKSGAN